MLDLSHAPSAGEDRLAGSLAYREAMALGGTAVPAPASPAAAFRLARRAFLAGERVEMQAIAVELGVSRQTLYRWAGSREQLLADVLFGLSDAVFDTAIRETADLGGAERLLAVFRHHVTALVSSRPLATFLRGETQAALRILTARHGSVNPRTVRRLAGLYRDEQRAGRFAPRADVETLAFAVVCLTESFIYDDGPGGVEPAVERAAAVVALLLGA